MPALNKNTTMLCLTWLLLLLCLVFPALTKAQENSDQKILVLPWGMNAQFDELEKEPQDMLRRALQELGLRVPSREKTQDLLDELEIRDLDMQTAQRLATEANADFAVYGNVNQIGEELSLDGRLVSATQLELSQPLFVSGYSQQELTQAMQDLGGKIQDRVLAGQRIAEIEIQGNEYLDQDAILNRLSLRVGDPYAKQQLSQEIKRLFDSGFFQDIQVHAEQTPEGQRVVFQVQERPLIREIKIKGAEELKEKEILEIMQVESGDMLNPRLIKEDLSRISELYRKEGYYRAEAEYSQTEVKPGQIDLIIELEENEKQYIREIDIQGAEKISPGKLKKKLALKERGFFSWITGRGVLKEELLDRDAAALEVYYTNQGFVDAQVGQPQVEYTQEGIQITFQVQEGPRYKVGQVDFSGDIVEDEQTLYDLIQLDDLAQEDDYFDRSILQEDRQNLEEFYANQGYAFAEAGIDLQKNSETNTLNVTYRLQKRQKVHIRRLQISGNHKTRDNVIRREMLLAEGDQFQGRALTQSKQRLQRLGHFKNVDIESIPTQEPDLMDLKVQVEEQPTGSFSLGAGYSSIDNVFFTGQIQEDNFLGKGYTLGFKGSISSKSSQYQFSFWNPHVRDSRLGAGFDAYSTSREYNAYDLERTGARAKFAYSIGNYTRLHWNYELEEYTIDEVDPNASWQIKDIEGENWSSSAEVRTVRNTTDRSFAPTQGTKNILSVENSGGVLGGDDNFIKTKLENSYYKTLFWKLVFHWHFELGYLFENKDDRVPDHERFYLGGIRSVRGYEYQDISSFDEQGREIGGYKSFFNNLELVFPLAEDMGLLGVLFFDAGNVWGKDTSPEFDFYKSVGAGIRWNSPMGPLRLEYGYPLDDLKGNDGRFEFTVGQFF
ncbi:MAG: outer membrane protein assembly factor BamA [Desulfohalobiaceae bacterium]